MIQRAAHCSSSTHDSRLVLNASRVGKRGGLLTFSIALLECLTRLRAEVEAVLPEGVAVPAGVNVVRIPGWLASSSMVSSLRPILWLLYSTFFFPVARRERTLCSTHHVLPFRGKQVVTVHDLRPYYEPDSWVQHFYFRHMLPRSLRRCDGILTVSEATKQVITTTYGIAAEKIHVVPNAVSLPAFDGDSTTQTSSHSEPFLLMVGASWKHKNALEVLENHVHWKNDYQLKIVAGRGQHSEQLRNRAHELGIGSKVQLIHDVGEMGMRDLYQGCSALVYPSKMEGFGLPPLEAMAYGKPVIVSDIPVFHELMGETPFFVRLGNSASWAAAFRDLREAIADPNHWRRSAGRELAGSYSIDRMQACLSTALEAIWNI